MTAIIVKSLIKQTTTTEGSGDIVLSGTSSGFKTFASALTDGDMTTVMVRSGATWELLRATWQLTGTTLVVDAVLENSNGDTSKIDWSAGTRDVYVVDDPAGMIRQNDGNSFLVPTGKSILFTDGTDEYELEISASDFVIRQNGTIHFRIDKTSNKVDIPIRLTGLEVDGTVIKQAGTSIGTAAFLDTGTTSGKIAVLTTDGVFSPARLINFVGTDGVDAGVKGAVPAPTTAQQFFYLRGDGSFVEHPIIKRETFRTSFAANTLYSFSHGISAYPDDYFAELECTSTELGYAVGRRVRLPAYAGLRSDDTTTEGVVAIASSSAVEYFVMDGITLPNTSTGVRTPITLAKWKIRAVAIKYNVS